VTALDDAPSFPVGSLVTARDRDWVVQSGSTSDLLRLRPIAGADDDVIGIIPALEHPPVRGSAFDPPTIQDLGTSADAQLLRDAFRIGVSDPAGPFRGFGRIAVQPRPYQLVPLLMALRLVAAPDDDAHPSVRMLISDDVGVGKTIESLLIANELYTTGEADGISIVCPPHLADQWVAELQDKFHLDAVKVGAGTVRSLERGLATGESLFDRNPITVVSLDWVKSRRRRDEYAQAAPSLVIVDEAHLCAKDTAKTGKHRRNELLRALAAEPLRHLLLVTATPHSGKEGAFRSLIALLHPRLTAGDTDLDLTEDERALLARHFVARKRIDVADYLGDTNFPTRIELASDDGVWEASPALADLIRDAIEWARPALDAARTTGDARTERVWWWTMLGLVRALGSSPAAGVATLRKRSGIADPDIAPTAADVDDLAETRVADPELDSTEADDIETGAAVDPDHADRLGRFADRLAALAGPAKDPKLAKAIRIAKDLIAQGRSPIFFCRFIATAEYLAEHLAAIRGVEVRAVTGATPAEVRADDVRGLGTHERRILVATDCLSEGINLQDRFDAVVHYDLPWNPTRLEQREGRVDRYGQPSAEIRIGTMRGGMPTLDPFITEHLINKHRAIKNRLGFSIPVPGITGEIISLAFSEWLGEIEGTQLAFELDTVTRRWEEETERELEWVHAEGERRSRAKFAQSTIRPTEVAEMADAVAAAIGTPTDVAQFLRSAITTLHGTAKGPVDAAADPSQPAAVLRLGLDGLPGPVHADLAATFRRRRDELTELHVRLVHPEPVVYGSQTGVVLPRTHPFVAALARHITDPAMDRHVRQADRPAARLGVTLTDAVEARTWLLTLRFRFDLDVRRRIRQDDGSYRTDAATHLVEDVHVIAISGGALLDDGNARTLTGASPTGNLADGDRRRIGEQALERTAGSWKPLIEEATLRRGQLLEEQHLAARTAIDRERRGLGTAQVHPHPDPDILAITCLIPTGGDR
jgi:superfamily II DNA or RNA helicase